MLDGSFDMCRWNKAGNPAQITLNYSARQFQRPAHIKEPMNPHFRVQINVPISEKVGNEQCGRVLSTCKYIFATMIAF